MASAPRLSILIPSIPERFDTHFKPLYDKLTALAAGHPVEVLALVDNRMRSIGAKRQALLDIAKGDYVVFVDDDDEVYDRYVEAIVGMIEANPGVDVVLFDQHFTFNGNGPHVIRFDHECKQDQQVNLDAKPYVATRRPWHVVPYRRAIAQEGTFGDINYGEDAIWVDQVAPLVMSAARIPEVLSHYRYDENITRAED